MQTVSTIGLDIAKSVFQVHGVDASGSVAIRRQLKCRQVTGFFQKCRRAWSASRPLPRHTIALVARAANSRSHRATDAAAVSIAYSPGDHPVALAADLDAFGLRAFVNAIGLRGTAFLISLEER